MGVNASSPAPTGPGSQLDGARVRVAVKERYRGFLPKYINLHATVSEEKVRLAARHWHFVADDEDDSGMQDAGLGPTRLSVFYDAFYHKLFEKLPEAKSLFDGNMVRQSRALVKMMSWLSKLEVTDDLVSKLEALADRHVEYGCLPAHYEAGGDALQCALQATLEDQDPTEAKVVMNAWKDLYSFVILVVIPRTALRLDESARIAGPLTTMLRPTPISGTRLEVLATTPPPCINNASNWQRQASRGGGDHHGGGSARRLTRSRSVSAGSPRRLDRPFSMGTPDTAAATFTAGEEQLCTEWFGTGGRAPDVALSGSVASLGHTSSRRQRRSRSRSRSGARRRSDSLPARSGSGDGGWATGGRESGFDILGAPWTRDAGAGGWHKQVTPHADEDNGEEDSIYTRRDSLLSTTSSVASGLHLRSVGIVETMNTMNSACVSPDGSAVGATGRAAARQTAGRGKGEGRRSRLLRGQEKLSYSKGGGGDARMVLGSSSSPRSPTLRAHARVVPSARPRRHNDSTAGGRRRARHGRSSSMGGGPTVTAVGAAGKWDWGRGDWALSSEVVGASPRGRDVSGFQPQRRHPERIGFPNISNVKGSGGSGGDPPAVASPAGSSRSFPSSRSSWDKSGTAMSKSRGASGGGGGLSSSKQPTRLDVAPTARTPTSAILARLDYGWLEGCSNSNSGGGGGNTQKRDEREPSSRRMPPMGARDSTFSSVGGNVDSSRSTFTASMASPSKRPDTEVDVVPVPAPPAEPLAWEPPATTAAAAAETAAQASSTLLPTNSRDSVEPTTSSHCPHGRDDAGGGSQAADQKRPGCGGTPAAGKGGLHQASPPRATERRGSGGGSGDSGCDRELHIDAPGDGPLEEPLRVTPEVADARVLSRFPLSPAESPTGSRRVGRRSESGSSSARERIRAERLERKAELDEDGIFSDDDEVFGEGGGRGGDETETARRASQMFGFLDGDDGGGRNTSVNGAPRRRNGGERSNESDVGVVDSIGANVLAYFHKKLDQSQESGSWSEGDGDGGNVGGATGRGEGVMAARGGYWERKAAEEATADEKQQVEGEVRALPTETHEQTSSQEEDQQQQRQSAEGTGTRTRAENEKVETEEAEGSKCATTRAVDTPTTAVAPTPSHAAAVSVCTAVTAANNTLSPPMWEPSRPIVLLGQAPPSSAAAASVLPAYSTEEQAPYNFPPASPPLAASAGDADEAHSVAVLAGRGGDAHGGRPAAAVDRPSSAELPSAIRIQQRQQQHQQQGQIRPDTSGIARKPENTPMLLPPMEGSGHAAPADDVGGATFPAAGSRAANRTVVSPSSAPITVTNGGDNLGGRERVTGGRTGTAGAAGAAKENGEAPRANVAAAAAGAAKENGEAPRADVAAAAATAPVASLFLSSPQVRRTR
eukprot:g16551.t1